MNHRGNDNATFLDACGEDFFIREVRFSKY